ncbi:MAG: acetylornithine deacetylase/succinyldiaminopimelate desuccinylase-like deacylase [Phycisphaerales bacterium]|nr:acetylornithine deacetylase/succinyldiaminopimelate desuccinylase-like deacylase [Phycisphaerales bacterium]
MAGYTPILDWIDSQAPRMRRLVREWSDVNSGSHNVAGLATMLHRLRSAWEPLGGDITELSLPDEETIDSVGKIVNTPLGKALQIRKRPDAPLRAFLCIHMDTVYPADSAFQRCELLDDNTLRGPGVADAKGGLAVMLLAVEALERSPWARSIGWEVLINPDEELGSPGSAPLFDEAARRNHLGLLFEPAMGEGDLVSERGGSGSFELIVHGRSAHAGRDPKAGRNAINAMAEMIGELNLLELNGTTPDGVTINVGKVEGGGPVNVVPDLAICRFNVRVKTPQDQSAAGEGILNFFRNNERKRDGIRLEMHGGFHRPPKPLDPQTARLLDHTVACGKELGLSLGHRRSGGVSDGNQLAAAGLPNLDSLGPRGGKIHSPEEYVLLDSLPERAKLTALLLMELASGEIKWPKSIHEGHEGGLE